MKEYIGVRLYLLAKFCRALKESINSKGRNSARLKRWNKGASRLRNAVKHGVPTLSVGFKRMKSPLGVAKLDAMFFTRPSAIAVTRARREERREDAVLHVKRGNIMVGCYLKLRTVT